MGRVSITIVLWALVGCSADSASEQVEPLPARCAELGRSRPVPRGEMAGVFDLKRNRIVFQGGDLGLPEMCIPAPELTGETWLYDVECGRFEPVEATNGPGVRTRAAAALDTTRDRMLLFGGRTRDGNSGPYTVLGDLWSLDLETLQWGQVETRGDGPSGRANTVALYDDVRDALWVFGGNNSTDGAAFAPLRDTWVLSLEDGTWREVSRDGLKPSARLFHGGAIDAGRGFLFVYAGGDERAFTGPFLDDLWGLDIEAEQWVQLHDGSGSAPFKRIWPSLVLDRADNRLVLFGGHRDDTLGNTNDMWAYDLAERSWQTLVPPEVPRQANGFCDFPADFTDPNLEAPERRSAQLVVHDAAQRLAYVFGGKTDCGSVDDVWVYDLQASSWTELVEARAGESCARAFGADQCGDLCQVAVQSGP